MNPENTPPPIEVAILLSIAGGLYFGYGAPRLKRWGSSKIKVGTKTLLLQRGDYQSIAWTDVSSFRFDQLEDMHVLQLALRKGRTLAVGLHESVNREHLEQFLRSLGIPCEDDGVAI
jgi:hypothetical protein